MWVPVVSARERRGVGGSTTVITVMTVTTSVVGGRLR